MIVEADRRAGGRHLALSACSPAAASGCARERDDGRACRARSMADGHGRDPGAQRGRRHRRDHRLAAAPGLCRARSRSSWWTTTAATAPPTSRAGRRRSRRGRAAADHRRPAAAARLDRQAMGGQAGRRRGASGAQPPDYLLCPMPTSSTRPTCLRALVARAAARGLVLTSLMVKLRCESFAERSLIPAFIFFFQMLYPFAWVNQPRRARPPPQPAAACWSRRRAAGRGRHRRDPQRADRRLRARASCSRRRARSGSA